MSTEKKRLIAYVGRNHVDRFEGGGISVFEISADGSSITPLPGGVEDMPKRAGYLAYAPKAGVLYAVDERKTDGRGPKKPASGVLSFRVDPQSGKLTFLNKQPTVGAMPGLHHRRRREETPLHREPWLLRPRGQGGRDCRWQVGGEVRI